MQARRAVREVVLKQAGTADRLGRGHPWVWRDAIARGLDGAAPGDEVQLLAPDGSPAGRGIIDPTSPIAVRRWTHGRDPIDAALWRSRVGHACERRAALFVGSDTNAFRVLHGEGDRMPGIVVDRYGSVAIARTDGEAASTHVDALVDAVWPALEAWGVETLALRTGVKGEAPRLDGLRGPPPPATVEVQEYGVPFIVDLARGQKTGAFLDQRDNRRRVGELARGRRVLNLFSYAGGFSLHAALGGATHVTSVDIASGAHATAQASFRAAGLTPGAHAFVTADVNVYLEGAAARGERWDLVVSDPPSFAPSEKALGRALSAYRNLHAACVRVLAPGGIFCAASCSSHVDPAAFLTTLDDATLGQRDLALVEVRGPGADHPTLPSFPEGHYLKFAILA